MSGAPRCGCAGGRAVGGTGVLVDGALGTFGGGLAGRLVEGEWVRSYVGSTGGWRVVAGLIGAPGVAGSGVLTVPATAPPGTGGRVEPSPTVGRGALEAG